MRSTVTDTLPPRVKRALGKLGADIALARKKRSLTIMMMAERLGVAKSTYLKIEKGDPTVAMGAYAMTFFVLGFDEALTQIVDAHRDEQGLLLDAERLPKRVRVRKPPGAI
ncbi:MULTISPECIES: helix-turn-helix domain-containing protein [Mesorhizobium]|uniref:Transcriptional regulator, XRE family n=1 Tax=Mesorhizobium escarrei TaxID=666018 RepID=A0ABN8JM89_9HYPH|nr:MULTISPECIES: helix-turn-helix domain-containing protein [Mesorhizobium]CAH2398151.1 Transcriptional regulator, XRE family [Mesorhizobium escarrei]